MNAGNPIYGLIKLVAILMIAALILLLVGCESARAADAEPTDPPALDAEEPAAAPMADPAPPMAAMPAKAAKRKPNNLDVIFGFQVMNQADIDVPTATEEWKIRGGGSSWLGYRRDIGDGLFSFGGKIGARSCGILQENSTSGLDYQHSLQSIFLMPNARLSVPLGTPRALWFVDLGVGFAFHEFVLDEDVPNGTPKPTVAASGAIDLMSGFVFCVYDGDARVDIGFNFDFLGAQADIKKIYPAGTPAADKFKKFNLGHGGIDFNLTVKF